MRFVIDLGERPEGVSPEELEGVFRDVLTSGLDLSNGDTLYLNGVSVKFDDVEGDAVPRRSFAVWLRGQEKRNDLVGDLARDVKIDRQAPTGRVSKNTWRDYLSVYGSHVAEAFGEAWSEFAASGSEAVSVR